MPTTAMKIIDEKLGEIRVKIITNVVPGGVDLFMHQCDHNWIPTLILSTSFKKDANEFEIHKELRDGAIALDQFVLNESTNPELNPELYGQSE